MIGWLSLGSIFFGLLAWVVPMLGMKQRNKMDIKKKASFFIVSFGACTVALCMQVFEINERVKLQDWSALMDTCGVLTKVCVVLIAITVLLNIIALWFLEDEKEKK